MTSLQVFRLKYVFELTPANQRKSYINAVMVFYMNALAQMESIDY